MVLEVAHDIKANLASGIISSFYQLQIVGAIGHLHLTRIEMCLGPVYTPSLHPHNEPSEYAPTQVQMYGFLMAPIYDTVAVAYNPRCSTYHDGSFGGGANVEVTCTCDDNNCRNVVASPWAACSPRFRSQRREFFYPPSLWRI